MSFKTGAQNASVFLLSQRGKAPADPVNRPPVMLDRLIAYTCFQAKSEKHHASKFERVDRGES